MRELADAIPLATLLHAIVVVGIIGHARSEPIQVTIPLTLNLDQYDTIPPDDHIQIGCLALAIYGEGRGEGVDGMRSIAHVIMNRTLNPRYASTPCEVILEPYQFESVGADTSLRVDVVNLMNGYHVSIPHIPDLVTKDLIYDVADAVYTYKIMDDTYMTSFWAPKAQKKLNRPPPKWSYVMQEVATIDEHIFYK